MDTLKFMEHIEYFYEKVNSAYGDEIFTVYLKEGVWEITKGQEMFGTTNTKDAFNYLSEQNVDLGNFHALVYDKVCTEGVLRRMQLKKIEELVGSEAIDTQEEGWANFAKQIVGIIDKEDKPKLAIV